MIFKVTSNPNNSGSLGNEEALPLTTEKRCPVAVAGLSANCDYARGM